MKTIQHLFAFLLLFQNLIVPAQELWMTTNDFQGGPKTGIAISNDSVLLVSTLNAVLRSTDECYSLELVLRGKQISAVFAAQNGLVLAGGNGMVYFSDNTGLSWDSAVVNSNYPFTRFIENSNGELFAINGVEDDGDGVFYSANKGRSWEKRNNGLGTYLGCQHIAIDKNNRLYLSISDFIEARHGGFYSSENNGISWEKISIAHDSLANPVRVGIPYNLSVLPNDRVYIGFEGISYKAFISLNLYKSTDEIKSDSSWKVMKFKNHNNWWEDNPVNSMHMAQNGDWYSSLNGAVHLGGTCFSSDGVTWEILDDGLGSDTMNMRNEQFFAETSEGKIFMIQKLDERIYKTGKSILTSAPIPIEFNPRVSVYPNPVPKGERLTVQFEAYSDASEISLYNITGKKLYRVQVNDTRIKIPAPNIKGIYILMVQQGDTGKALKFVVD